jgi:hypothetical protein
VAAVEQSDETSQDDQHNHEPPAGWIMEESEDYPGHYFYVNIVTDEVTWERPEEAHAGKEDRTPAATVEQSDEEDAVEIAPIVEMFPSGPDDSITANPLRQGAPTVIEATLEPNMARAPVASAAHIYRGQNAHGGRLGSTRGRGGRGRGTRGRG